MKTENLEEALRAMYAMRAHRQAYDRAMDGVLASKTPEEFIASSGAHVEVSRLMSQYILTPEEDAEMRMTLAQAWLSGKVDTLQG